MQTELALQRIARLTARMLCCPMAVISIQGEGDVWFPSGRQQPMSRLLRSTIAGDETFVITDTWESAAGHFPLVDTRQLRFCAGARIEYSNGDTIGTIAVMDVVPHYIFSEREESLLLDCAGLVADELELMGSFEQAISVASGF